MTGRNSAEEMVMRAQRTWVYLAVSMVAIALAVGGCGKDDGGEDSANAPSSESSGYGY
jgi:hypothetical protein